MHRSALLLLGIILAAPSGGSAQTRHGSVELRGGVTLGIASTSVGGESSTDVGALPTGQVGFVLSPRTELTTDLVVQPFRAHNPVLDEAFTAVYSLLGLQVGLGDARRAYLRPELGLVFRSWSGSEVFVESETSPVAGFAVGGEVALSARVGLAPEIFVRVSGADGLFTALWGLGVSVVPVGARAVSPSLPTSSEPKRARAPSPGSR